MMLHKQTNKLLDYDRNSILNNQSPQKNNEFISNNDRSKILEQKNQNHFQLQINNFPVINNSITTPSMKSRSSSSSVFIYDEVYDKNNLKRLLAEEYRNIIKNQKDHKQMQKRKERQIQKEIIQQHVQNEKKRKVQNLQKQINTKNIFMQHYAKSQQLKMQKKRSLIEQKEVFRENLQKKLNIYPQRDPSEYKNNLFKQFYKHYYKESAINDKMYLQQVRPLFKKRQQEIEKLTYGGFDRFSQKYRILEQTKKQQQIKKKQELMEILKNQINEKEQIRRSYSERKLNHYDIINEVNDKQRYNYYDTIKNPVNLGIDPKNKYIINHIRKSINQNPQGSTNSLQKDHMNRQSIHKMSVLARNGSQILF